MVNVQLAAQIGFWVAMPAGTLFVLWQIRAPTQPIAWIAAFGRNPIGSKGHALMKSRRFFRPPVEVDQGDTPLPPGDQDGRRARANLRDRRHRDVITKQQGAPPAAHRVHRE